MSEVTLGILEKLPGTGHSIHGMFASNTETRIDIGPVNANFISWETPCPPDAKQGYSIIPGQTIQLGKKKVTLVWLDMTSQKAHFRIS